MRKDDIVFLHHILDAIDIIEEYTLSLSFDEFMDQRQVQDAVVRRLEIIGEAARNISNGFRSDHPQVPWGQIIALRNRITHAYFAVDLEIVWDIVQQDLPELREQLEALMK